MPALKMWWSVHIGLELCRFDCICAWNNWSMPIKHVSLHLHDCTTEIMDSCSVFWILNVLKLMEFLLRLLVFGMLEMFWACCLVFVSFCMTNNRGICQGQISWQNYRTEICVHCMCTPYFDWRVDDWNVPSPINVCKSHV